VGMKSSHLTLAAISSGAALLWGFCPARAAEQLFGLVPSAETLPQGRSELYQFATLRTGKAEGSYYAAGFQTEIDHGFTDKFQAGLSAENRWFNIQSVNGQRDALANKDEYRFGGVAAAAEYRVLSTFKDPFGLAVRLQSGYLFNNDLDGQAEHEFFLAPEVAAQKDFRDDTLITAAWAGTELAWGQRPAAQSRELAWQGGAGVAWRFTANWFAALEGDARAEYPHFDLNRYEHAVLYAGPSLHYSARRWWLTLTYLYQAWGRGVGEPTDGRTYGEETDMQLILKLGFNF
jgi:Family of unknown function (DUF6662)